MTEQKAKMGRPYTYTEEWAERICTDLKGGLSLTKVCKQEGFPPIATVFDWLTREKEFSEKYSKAQLARTDFLMEELIDIADDASNEDVQHAKLRVDARKWAISKMNPKKYGDKIEQTHAGSVEIQQITRKIVDPIK